MQFDEVTRLPLWRSGRGGEQMIHAAIDDWVHSTAMCALVSHFGGERLPRRLGDALTYLDQFSARTWDFRRGRERHSSSPKLLPEVTGDLVYRAAEALGLAGAKPPALQRYDHILVLGARLQICILRARLAADLVHSGIAADEIAGLASLRPADPEEQMQGQLFGLADIGSEFDVMDGSLRTEFGLTTRPVTRTGGDPPEDPRRGWRLHTYDAHDYRVRVVAAPSSDPGARRANTADTLVFWATATEIGPNHRLLLVTSTLHHAFQHCDAIRVLGIPFGCSVDTVSLDPSSVRDEHIHIRYSPTTILQEIRSTIRSMRTLHRRLAAQDSPVTAEA